MHTCFSVRFHQVNSDSAAEVGVYSTGVHTCIECSMFSGPVLYAGYCTDPIITPVAARKIDHVNINLVPSENEQATK